MTEPTAAGVDEHVLGRAPGLLWACGVVVSGLAARRRGGAEWRDLLASVYPGYDSSTTGILAGAVRAFVGGYPHSRLDTRFRPSAS